MDQIYLPKLSKVNKSLIIISVSAFLLSAILEKTSGISLVSFFGLSFNGVTSGKVFQLFTYPFLSTGVFELVINCLMLWLMGSEFETSWGVRRYLLFLFFVVLGAALLVLGVAGLTQSALQAYPIVGLSGIVTSLCVAYAFLYPERLFSFMMIFPVKAKIFCLILAGISLYQGFFTMYAVGAWSQLGAMAFGFLFMYVTTKTSLGKMSRSGQTMNIWDRPKKSKAKLSIVRDDDPNDKPKYWH